MMIGFYASLTSASTTHFCRSPDVIGYSVMDTIVILDRIRENTKLMDGEPYDRIVNTSIFRR